MRTATESRAVQTPVIQSNSPRQDHPSSKAIRYDPLSKEFILLSRANLFGLLSKEFILL
jgi:hypothetical protein